MICNKSSFESKSAARKDIKMLSNHKRRQGQYGSGVSAYLCKECDKWHTTRSKKLNNKKIMTKINQRKAKGSE